MPACTPICRGNRRDDRRSNGTRHYLAYLKLPSLLYTRIRILGGWPAYFFRNPSSQKRYRPEGINHDSAVMFAPHESTIFSDVGNMLRLAGAIGFIHPRTISAADYLSMLNSFWTSLQSLFPNTGTNAPTHSHDINSHLQRRSHRKAATLLVVMPRATLKAPIYPSAVMSLSPSRPGTTLTYHLVTLHLALLALLPTTVYGMHRRLAEWNVVRFREGLGRYGNLGWAGVWSRNDRQGDCFTTLP
ncbi:hypothetical protein DFJ58DRAFT_860797 [Suillus subalutaceus]|uniref:uncharacterized protein n=1 Tax=Suillus subalutaceus TaxID=48586 RepID=UPI001B87CFC5|nr:uncharacterized protein DFJ58DRAFT_860797 [Suillus subalutaceus]KAG1838803.1 hypothetical protein DFJ58DRAFT_860797 [Suillus subalutaceus]